MNIVIGIATAGRRDILSMTIEHLAKQKRLPDCLYICPASPNDVDISCLKTFSAPSKVINGSRGLTHQRNAIMRNAEDSDLIVFFDDDFLADIRYLEEAEKLFINYPETVIATGCLIADDAKGPGLSVDDGLKILESSQLLNDDVLVQTYSGYGCNMVVRTRLATIHAVEFDEKLPQYGWWEDVDFSRRLAPYGVIYRSNKLRGVHLGSKSGRSQGKKLGYSQVANLIYLHSKGSISRNIAFKRIAMNVLANLVRSLFPEPWVDRRGRLAGNIIAFGDLINGTLSPENINRFD